MQQETNHRLRPGRLPKQNTSKGSLGPAEYIERNYSPSDRLAVVILNRATGETIQRITSAEKIASPEFQAWLRHKNAQGADIYISQNALRPGSRSRTKADLETIRHVYLDLDRNGDEALQKIDASNLVPAPSFVIRTSPQKYQVIWKVSGMSPGEAELLQKAMVAELGGDRAATDSSRVLRLPGFRNKKYEENYLVEAYEGNRETYAPSDFKISRENLSWEARTLEAKNTRGMNSGESSQSERDWAFVRQQLGKGVAPERLVETLVHFRRDKSTPDYYARQTVSRAYAAIALERGDPPAEIEKKITQIATHQPHPSGYARQTIAEMKTTTRGMELEAEQPGGGSRVL
jgi:hypothetical protein